ncbi:MAG: 30S ribosomal protein S11 [Bacteroidetes bacterium]|jgi:small subunit ribosomal protein S11|nr:30S ribosomal protein S11 [Bacteroidota bacterium]
MAKAKGKAPAKKAGKKRNMKVDSEGMAYVQATFNNVIVTLTNKKGQVISWSSAGKAGFRGSKKNTPYAAQVAATEASKTAYDNGLRTVEVFVKGPGSGREAAIRAIDQAGIKVTRIKDVTPIPHNGCRPPKRRRV